MLGMNWPVVDTVQPQSDKLAMGVKIKATGALELYDSPSNGNYIVFLGKTHYSHSASLHQGV